MRFLFFLSTISTGQDIDIRYTVENKGTGTTATPFWQDEVWLSKDDVIGGGDDRLKIVHKDTGLVPSGNYEVKRMIRTGHFCFSHKDVEQGTFTIKKKSLGIEKEQMNVASILIFFVVLLQEVVTVAIPHKIFGDFYILVQTDVRNSVYEHLNEDNNVGVSQVGVSASSRGLFCIAACNNATVVFPRKDTACVNCSHT